MPAVAFTSNIDDMCTNEGYQFKFNCMRCGNGYTSAFHRSITGFGGRLMAVGGGLLGGGIGGDIESAGWNATYLHDSTGSPTKDKELDKAAGQVKDHFLQCNRCGTWVCKQICWNEERGLCVGCAPKVKEEVAFMQAQAQRDQLQTKIAAGDLTQGVNYTDQATGLCPSCHEESGGGKFCQHCGAALAAAPTATKRFCKNCGTEIVGPTRFCGECGTPAA